MAMTSYSAAVSAMSCRIIGSFEGMHGCPKMHKEQREREARFNSCYVPSVGGARDILHLRLLVHQSV